VLRPSVCERASACPLGPQTVCTHTVWLHAAANQPRAAACRRRCRAATGRKSPPGALPSLPSSQIGGQTSRKCPKFGPPLAGLPLAIVNPSPASSSGVNYRRSAFNHRPSLALKVAPKRAPDCGQTHNLSPEQTNLESPNWTFTNLETPLRRLATGGHLSVPAALFIFLSKLANSAPSPP